MNIYQVVVLSLGCILGLLICGSDAQGYYPYNYYGGYGGGSESGLGGGAFFAFIGLIFIIIVLFSGFNRNTGAGTIAVMNITG